MTDDGVQSEATAAVRQAIGGDEASIRWLLDHADSITDVVALTMAALLERHAGRLERATGLARTNRERQVVAVARAHLAGDAELVDALVRDHLADYPDSLIVSWVASEAVVRAKQPPSEPTTRLQ